MNLDNLVIGVTGAWIDDDDSGTPRVATCFDCTGVSQVIVNVSLTFEPNA